MLQDEKKIIRRLSAVGIYGNLALTAFKLFAGITGNSGAMVSDAVHSLSDVFATFISFIGARLSRKAADKEHPYGHDRIESFASAVLGAVLLCTGVGIGVSSVRQFLSPEPAEPVALLPLIAAIVSIVTKEGMYRYTIYYANRMNSSVFRADAWHHRSDALSSVGALIGIAAARFGIGWAEPAASLVICVFIVRTGVMIVSDALKSLLDASCGADFEKQLADCVLSVQGVEKIDLLRTRRFGNDAYADLEIAVDRTLSVVDAHDIAEQVHKKAESTFPELKHIMIHVNPLFSEEVESRK